MTDKEKIIIVHRSTGVRRDMKTATKLLNERGLSQACIIESATALASGWDDAFNFCAAKKSEMRGAWEAITRERWGTAKAEQWQAPVIEAALLPQLRNAHESLTENLAAAQKELDKAEKAQQKITRHNITTGLKYKCPKCEEALIIVKNVLVFDNIKDDIEPDIEVQKAAQIRLRDAKAQVAMIQGELQKNEAAAKESENAERNRQALTDRAAVYLAEYQNWDALAAAYGPGGIQLQLLERALVPLNERLKQTCEITGWKDITIRSDMVMSYGGIAYGLLSESERWRVGVAISEAISAISGTRMFVVDRMDVLHPDLRGGLINWLLAVQGDHDTIMVMATLKGKPTGLPPAIQSVWLEQGGVANGNV